MAGDRPSHEAGDVFATTKLHIPGLRPGLVAREPLVELLVAGRHRKLTLVDAPAGSGKTTLLAEWRASPRERRPFAWLTLDSEDNDPARFWTGVVRALRTLEPGFGELALAALETGIALREVVLPLLVNELAELERPLVLVLDDYQAIDKEEVHRSLSFLLERLPRPLHVALATRFDPPLPLARMRVRDELTEVRADDLRFGEDEAAALLRGALGLELDADEVGLLRRRTEGWAAGLYLAALSVRGRSDAAGFIRSFAGDDRHVVDYLSREVLAGQPEEVRRFLLRTSVLERLCGPLCDALVGGSHSALLLTEIESRNLFLIPLDTTRTWYRYHQLFGELLRHELALTEPPAVPELHRRAAVWYRARGLVRDAIHHAAAAGDTDDARELVASHWNEFFNRGRLETVARWLDALPRPAVRNDPRLCVAGAWLALDRGRLEEARAWIDSAGAAMEGRQRRAALRPELEALRAVQAFKAGDVAAAGAAARRTLALGLDEAAFPRTVAQLILGITHYFAGEAAAAETALAEAARLAARAGNDLGRSYALGYLGLLRAAAGDGAGAERYGVEATGLSDAPGFVEHFVTMAGHLACGRAAELAGQLEEAEARLERALALAGRGAGRPERALAALALGRVRQALGHAEAARALLREARQELAACPDPGRLGAQLSAAEALVGAARRGAGSAAGEPPEELTERELAVLRLLGSQLSRREIADALYVSDNTVKTHVRSIFRKLDAASRDEAVERGRELALL